MHRLQLQIEKQMLYKLYFNNDDISSAVIRIVEWDASFCSWPKMADQPEALATYWFAGTLVALLT